MAVYLMAIRERVVFRIGIELGKEVFYCCQAKSEYKGLIMVIIVVLVVFVECFGYGYLRYFFVIVGNVEFGFFGQYFFVG